MLLEKLDTGAYFYWVSLSIESKSKKHSDGTIGNMTVLSEGTYPFGVMILNKKKKDVNCQNVWMSW